MNPLRLSIQQLKSELQFNCWPMQVYQVGLHYYYLWKVKGSVVGDLNGSVITIYNPSSQLPLSQKFWWEAFGMFFLIILISFIDPFYGFDFWISSILPIAIMLSVKQSGAHYNPSMSMSNFFIKFSPTKFSPFFMWTYFKAQFVPAFIAYNIAFYMKGYYYPPDLAHNFTQGIRIVASQMIGTIMLVIMLQKIANSQTTFTTSDIETYSFVVVFVYVARKFAVVSGNNINPVANFACVCAAVVQCNFDAIIHFNLYLLGDFLGSCIGTWFYNHMLQPAISISRKQRIIHQQNFNKTIQQRQGDEQSLSNFIKQISKENESREKQAQQKSFRQSQQQERQIHKYTKIEHKQDPFSLQQLEELHSNLFSKVKTNQQNNTEGCSFFNNKKQ